jgi:hypothetical protein
VRARVVQVFALDVNLGALELTGQVLGKRERCRPARVTLNEPFVFGPELGISPGRLECLDQFLEGLDQHLRYKTSPEARMVTTLQHARITAHIAGPVHKNVVEAGVLRGPWRSGPAREWDDDADDLACCDQLSKTRDVMSIFLQTRPCAVRARQAFGRGAGSLFLAVVACAALACSEDSDPADQTGTAGGVNVPDASVRELPGDGLEPTPDFDTDTRQREPIGPEQLVETIDEIRNGIGGSRGDAPNATDAAAPADDADAGAN